MNADDLERLRTLTCRFYREARTSADQDSCCAFLDLVNEARTDLAPNLRKQADALWAAGDKSGATRLHEKAADLVQSKGLT